MKPPKIIDAEFTVVSGPRERIFGSWAGLFWFVVVFGSVALGLWLRGG